MGTEREVLSLKNEETKDFKEDVKEYCGYYFRKDGVVFNKKGKRRKVQIDKGGYRVHVRFENKYKAFTLSRVLYYLFIEEFDMSNKNIWIQFKDDNPLNISLDNLCLVNSKEGFSKLANITRKNIKKVIICEECGKKFEIHQGLRRKSCDECRDMQMKDGVRLYNQKNNAKEYELLKNIPIGEKVKLETNCIVCGKEFVTNRFEGARFCDDCNKLDKKTKEKIYMRVYQKERRRLVKELEKAKQDISK